MHFQYVSGLIIGMLSETLAGILIMGGIKLVVNGITELKEINNKYNKSINPNKLVVSNE